MSSSPKYVPVWNFTWTDFMAHAPYDYDIIQIAIICTGDLGKIDDDGYVHIVGRDKKEVKEDFDLFDVISGKLIEEGYSKKESYEIIFSNNEKWN